MSDDPQIDWDNRIVGYDVKPASAFEKHPQNWRTHPQQQRDAVRGSLNEVGWIDVAIENVRTGHLLDGHERVEQARANGDADVPYIKVDLTEDEERFALLMLDPLAELAQADHEALVGLSDLVDAEHAAVQSVIDSLADEAGASDASPPDDFPEYDEDIPTEYECPKCGYSWSGSPS